MIPHFLNHTCVRIKELLYQSVPHCVQRVVSVPNIVGLFSALLARSLSPSYSAVMGVARKEGGFPVCRKPSSDLFRMSEAP